jgi:hypothetical protein
MATAARAHSHEPSRLVFVKFQIFQESDMKLGNSIYSAGDTYFCDFVQKDRMKHFYSYKGDKKQLHRQL